MRGFYQLCPYRVKFYIADGVNEILVLYDNLAPITPLPEMAYFAVPLIEIPRIRALQGTHNTREFPGFVNLRYDMHVIWHKAISEYPEPVFSLAAPYIPEVLFVVFAVLKNGLPIITPYGNMITGTVNQWP